MGMEERRREIMLSRNIPTSMPQRREMNTDNQQEWINTDTVDGWRKIAAHWKKKYERKKLDYDNEHQRYISLNGMFEEIQNEFNGLLRKKNVDVEKLRLEEILSDYAAHKDIQEVVKESKQKPWVRVTWEMVILALGMIFVWQLATNETFRLWLSANMIGLVIIVIVALVAFMIFKPKVLGDSGGKKK